MMISLKQINKLNNLKIIYNKFNQLNNNLNNKPIIKQNYYNHNKNNNKKSINLHQEEKDIFLQQHKLIINNKQTYFNQT